MHLELQQLLEHISANLQSKSRSYRSVGKVACRQKMQLVAHEDKAYCFAAYYNTMVLIAWMAAGHAASVYQISGMHAVVTNTAFASLAVKDSKHVIIVLLHALKPLW